MALNLIPRSRAYGLNGGLASRGGNNFLAPTPLSINRAPTANDKANVGQLVIFGSTPYINVDGGTTWIPLANGAGSFTSLTVTGAISAGTGVTATTGGLTATAGNITATNGNLVLGTAGNKLSIATGANASIGTSAAMVAGTVTVATTAVTASSRIFLTVNTPGGTQGVLSAPTASIVAGTSFVINSSNAADTSTVNWWIVN